MTFEMTKKNARRAKLFLSALFLLVAAAFAPSFSLAAETFEAGEISDVQPTKQGFSIEYYIGGDGYTLKVPRLFKGIEVARWLARREQGRGEERRMFGFP